MEERDVRRSSLKAVLPGAIIRLPMSGKAVGILAIREHGEHGEHYRCRLVPLTGQIVDVDLPAAYQYEVLATSIDAMRFWLAAHRPGEDSPRRHGDTEPVQAAPLVEATVEIRPVEVGTETGNGEQPALLEAPGPEPAPPRPTGDYGRETVNAGGRGRRARK